MSSLFVPQSILDEMLVHAKETHPYEACGILAGKDLQAKKLFRIRNIDNSEATYNMEPSEQFKALKEIKALGIEMVAIYHSHPHSPAYPSQIDINRAFFPGTGEESYPGVAYVIVSLAGDKPEISAFIIEKAGVQKLEISIISD